MSVSPELRTELCAKCAEFEHAARVGCQPMIHLEAFVIHVAMLLAKDSSKTRNPHNVSILTDTFKTSEIK